MEKKILIEKFQEFFEGAPQLFFSPGRVNLIGEHIDYNGGQVFPAAITFGTYGAVLPRPDQRVRLYSENFKEKGVLEFCLEKDERGNDDGWMIYVKAVVEQFKKAGYNVSTGFDAYIEGNIPNGAGLSSSASLELLVAEILDSLNGLNLSMLEKVKMCQKAENEYVGVQCGIMDQFAIGMGKKDHAIRLNTDDLTFEYALADLKDCKILIMNTNKKRELADSVYNERRAQCDAALEQLQTKKKIEFLCDLSERDFYEIADILEDRVLYQRAKHAVTENERVKLAVSALEAGDLDSFGELLKRSHSSLRHDYEVTGWELDTMVDLACQQDGVLGARMTGAGFGGCAIALVKEKHLEEARKGIAEKYREIIGYEGDFYVASIGGGTGAWG